jgi:hypothetical protein
VPTAAAVRQPQLGLDGPTEQGGIIVRHDTCDAPSVQPDEFSLQLRGPTQHGPVGPKAHPHLVLLDVNLKSPGASVRLRTTTRGLDVDRRGRLRLVLPLRSACDAEASDDDDSYGTVTST